MGDRFDHVVASHEAAREGWPMETFMRLYGNLIVFVYHCFDRIVINGYLSMLSRPENVVYFFHKVVGISLITKEVLAQRTHDYQGWVKGFARNQNIPIQWAEKGVKNGGVLRAVVAPHGTSQALWGLLHLPEHGAGSHLALAKAQVPHRRSELPNPGQTP